MPSSNNADKCHADGAQQTISPSHIYVTENWPTTVNSLKAVLWKDAHARRNLGIKETPFRCDVKKNIITAAESLERILAKDNNPYGIIQPSVSGSNIILFRPLLRERSVTARYHQSLAKKASQYQPRQLRESARLSSTTQLAERSHGQSPSVKSKSAHKHEEPRAWWSDPLLTAVNDSPPKSSSDTEQRVRWATPLVIAIHDSPPKSNPNLGHQGTHVRWSTPLVTAVHDPPQNSDPESAHQEPHIQSPTPVITLVTSSSPSPINPRFHIKKVHPVLMERSNRMPFGAEYRAQTAREREVQREEGIPNADDDEERIRHTSDWHADFRTVDQLWVEMLYGEFGLAL